MKFSTFASLVFLLSAFVCGCDDWQNVEKLQAEVEAIHDLPMQKMDELEQLKTVAVRVFNETDSLKTGRRDSLRLFVKNAEKAHEFMFDWMAQYKAPDKKTMSDKAAIDYLRHQKLTAIEMSDFVLSTIENGKKLIKK